MRLSVRGRLSPELAKVMDIGSERGTSSWLTVIPVGRHGSDLHKGTFRYVLTVESVTIHLNMRQAV